MLGRGVKWIKYAVVFASCAAVSAPSFAEPGQEQVLSEIAEIKVQIDRLTALRTYQKALIARVQVDGMTALSSADFPAVLCADIESICAALPLSTQQSKGTP